MNVGSMDGQLARMNLGGGLLDVITHVEDSVRAMLVEAADLEQLDPEGNAEASFRKIPWCIQHPFWPFMSAISQYPFSSVDSHFPFCQLRARMGHVPAVASLLLEIRSMTTAEVDLWAKQYDEKIEKEEWEAWLYEQYNKDLFAEQGRYRGHVIRGDIEDSTEDERGEEVVEPHGELLCEAIVQSVEDGNVEDEVQHVEDASEQQHKEQDVKEVPQELAGGGTHYSEASAPDLVKSIVSRLNLAIENFQREEILPLASMSSKMAVIVACHKTTGTTLPTPV